MNELQLKRKFSNDTVFNSINRKFITLQEAAVKRNNVYLNKAITALIVRMKWADTLFEKTYSSTVFGGSFYKGTKISEPMEFDLDIIIKLPIIYDSVQFHSNLPGYTKIYVPSPKYTKICTSSEERILNALICDGYINQERFRRWIEGIMSKVMRELPIIDGMRALIVGDGEMYGITTRKSGPAFTLILSIPEVGIMNVDFVPALAFSKAPTNILNNINLDKFRNKSWLAIPKPVYETIRPSPQYHVNPNIKYNNDNDLYWRFSFFYQEKEILGKYGRVKPVIRQMKKLRDTEGWHGIASYYIETLFFHKLQTLRDVDNMPYTLFMYMMLKELYDACSRHKIPYYWDSRCNLLGKLSSMEMFNITTRLNRIITRIERQIETDSFIIARYILSGHELDRLMKDNEGWVPPLNEAEYIQQYIYVQDKNNSETSGAPQSCRIL